METIEAVALDKDDVADEDLRDPFCSPLTPSTADREVGPVGFEA